MKSRRPVNSDVMPLGNRMKTETSEWDDGSRTVYSYDDAGHEIQTTDLDADGNITTDIHYQLDQSGLCNGWHVYDRHGILAHRFEVDHLPSGLESENREYDVGGNLVRREVYFYDSDGRLKETHYYDSQNILRGTGVDQYNPDGSLIRHQDLDLEGNLLDEPAA